MEHDSDMTGDGMNMMGDGMMAMGWMWTWTILSVVIALATLAGVIYLAIVAARGERRQARAPREESATAGAILDERYAKGEIGEDEFRARRAILREG